MRQVRLNTVGYKILFVPFNVPLIYSLARDIIVVKSLPNVRSFNNWFSLNLRYEYYDDADGSRSGTVQELNGFTITNGGNGSAGGILA